MNHIMDKAFITEHAQCFVCHGRFAPTKRGLIPRHGEKGVECVGSLRVRAR
jgi:hypothetical protein